MSPYSIIGGLVRTFEELDVVEQLIIPIDVGEAQVCVIDGTFSVYKDHGRVLDRAQLIDWCLG